MAKVTEQTVTQRGFSLLQPANTRCCSPPASVDEEGWKCVINSQLHSAWLRTPSVIPTTDTQAVIYPRFKRSGRSNGLRSSYHK